MASRFQSDSTDGFGSGKRYHAAMGLWLKIRGLFGRRRNDTAWGGEFRQADLQPGQRIDCEKMVRHVVWIVFPRTEVDDATYESLGDRGYFKQLLSEDR